MIYKRIKKLNYKKKFIIINTLTYIITIIFYFLLSQNLKLIY